MARNYPNTTAKHFNISPDSDLSQLIKDHDLVMRYSVPHPLRASVGVVNLIRWVGLDHLLIILFS